METRCERHGQIEIGILTYKGQEFRALGASVQGKHITGYTKKVGKGHSVTHLMLTTFCGKTMLDCRWEIVERYHHEWIGETCAIVFRLTNGRFIVGYALGDDGMLFRGELVEGDFEDACLWAKQTSEHFQEIDQADEDAYFDHETDF